MLFNFNFLIKKNIAQIYNVPNLGANFHFILIFFDNYYYV